VPPTIIGEFPTLSFREVSSFKPDRESSASKVVRRRPRAVGPSATLRVLLQLHARSEAFLRVKSRLRTSGSRPGNVGPVCHQRMNRICSSFEYLGFGRETGRAKGPQSCSNAPRFVASYGVDGQVSLHPLWITIATQLIVPLRSLALESDARIAGSCTQGFRHLARPNAAPGAKADS
jgi:hypothetical protein